MPFILSYNKYNMTSYEILMQNSGPIKVKVLMNQINFNLRTNAKRILYILLLEENISIDCSFLIFL